MPSLLYASQTLLLTGALVACGGSGGAGPDGHTESATASSTNTNTNTTTASKSASATATATNSATASNTASNTGSTSGTGSVTASNTSSATSTSWWPSAYDRNGVPAKKDPGNHNVGQDCMNCHITTRPLAFGGTVFSGGAGVAHVQIGIKSSGSFYSAYSDSDGNVWLPSTTPDIDWTKAEIRSRSSAGEKIMLSDGWAGCNACHAATKVMTP